jgi:hypothetical protein
VEPWRVLAQDAARRCRYEWAAMHWRKAAALADDDDVAAAMRANAAECERQLLNAPVPDATGDGR